MESTKEIELERASNYLQKAISCEAQDDYNMACYYFYEAGKHFANVARRGPTLTKHWNDVGHAQHCVAKCKEREFAGRSGLSKELSMHHAAEEYVKAAQYYGYAEMGIEYVVENYTLAINLHMSANNPNRADALRQKIGAHVQREEMKKNPNASLMDRIKNEMACSR